MDDLSLGIMMKERVADRRREAAAAHLRSRARLPRRGLRTVVCEGVGNALIRLGRGIKLKYGLGPEAACCEEPVSRA